ncbi:hypothetical protein HY251_08770, partial [bacterium]|nr:hypothetical protein [bacterium]
MLRLLGTLREEIEAIRSRQAELYEVVVSFKDQLADVRSQVLEQLKGLPKSPYIAGQLVPAPRKREGVDDFRDLLATYLHGPTEPSEEEKPIDVDTVVPPEPEPPLEDVEGEDLEDDDDEEEQDERRPRRRPERGPDEDTRGLNRGPERDVEPFDLHPASASASSEDEDEGDERDDRPPVDRPGEDRPREDRPREERPRDRDDRDRDARSDGDERRGHRRGRRG